MLQDVNQLVRWAGFEARFARTSTSECGSRRWLSLETNPPLSGTRWLRCKGAQRPSLETNPPRCWGPGRYGGSVVERWSSRAGAGARPGPLVAEAGRLLSSPRRGRAPARSTRCGLGAVPRQRLEAVPDRRRPQRPGIQVQLPEPEVPLQARARAAAALVRRRRPRRRRAGRLRRPWAATRDARATKARSARPARPRRKTKSRPRARARRQERVTAGLAELDVWLRDQVRTGIAGASADGYRRFDGMAARMVDAQAPGVAGTLRRLPQSPSSGSGWPGRLLGRAGPCSGCSSPRTSGWPSCPSRSPPPSAAGRLPGRRPTRCSATAPVRDLWHVLGCGHESDSGNLITRRTWLRAVDADARRSCCPSPPAASRRTRRWSPARRSRRRPPLLPGPASAAGRLSAQLPASPASGRDAGSPDRRPPHRLGDDHAREPGRTTRG